MRKDIFVYISDIAATVTFWAVMTIFVVEQKEKRAYLKDLKSRFSAIHFMHTVTCKKKNMPGIPDADDEHDLCVLICRFTEYDSSETVSCSAAAGAGAIDFDAKI